MNAANRRSTPLGLLVLVLGLPVLALAGCSSDESSSDVLLSEWVVEPDPGSVDAGEVELTGDNQGGELHELVVVRADSADDLPTDEDGSVVEDELPEGSLVGEIEDIESGDQASATFDLESGNYVLFCNITEVEDDGEVESHFAEGMHSEFTVN
jgi:hypothetical protein